VAWHFFANTIFFSLIFFLKVYIFEPFICLLLEKVKNCWVLPPPSGESYCQSYGLLMMFIPKVCLDFFFIPVMQFEWHFIGFFSYSSTCTYYTGFLIWFLVKIRPLNKKGFWPVNVVNVLPATHSWYMLQSSHNW
jgi:hypothetical protein